MEGWMAQGSGPDTVENEFSESLRGPTGAEFDNQSSGTVDGDAIVGAHPGHQDADRGRAPPGGAQQPADVFEENASVLDAVTGAVAAPNPQTFLRCLVGALGQAAGAPAGNESSLGTVLRHLGHALEEALDEESAFQDLVDGLERKRFRSGALHEAVPIVAAFVARLVSQQTLRNASGATPSEIVGLIRAAGQVAREALEISGARGWRALPDIANSIARRAAQRDLSIATLAAVLPRLWARLGPGPRDASTPAPDHLPGRMLGELRRMVLSGPVEIVILER
jgi:hypothetical protein